MYYMWSAIERSQFEIWSVTSWFMWKRNNDHLHGNRVCESSSLLVGAGVWLVEYQAARDLEDHEVKGLNVGEVTSCRWVAPAKGLLKLIIDVVTFASKGATGISAVVRDHKRYR